MKFELNIQECVQCGYCCTKGPCAYGEKDEETGYCKYLSKPNDIGQKQCLRYDWIVENAQGFQYHPAFGAGCSSALFNTVREYVKANLKK